MCWDHLFARTTLHDPASAAIRHVIDTVGLLEFVFGVFRWQCWVCFCGTCCGVCLPTLVGAGPAAQIALVSTIKYIQLLVCRAYVNDMIYKVVHDWIAERACLRWRDNQILALLMLRRHLSGATWSGCTMSLSDVSALQCQCHWPLPAVGLCCHGCQRCLAVGAALAADW